MICALKHEKPHFCALPIEKYRLGRNDPLPPVPSTFGGTGTLTLLKVVPQIFFTKMTATDELTTTYKRLVNYLNVLVQSKKIYRGSQCPPPFPVRQVLRFSWLFKWVLSQITINEK